MDNLNQRYDIVKTIGAGGMGTVFMAKHPLLNRPVAIKAVKGDNREKVRRFAREAMLSSSFKQENLPAIYDYFVDTNNNHFLVMEYVEGTDVSEILKKKGPFPAAVVAMIAREVARGLEHMHAQNIIHRDIKPSNVRIGTDGQVKLMDFGIAKSEEQETDKPLTATGIIIGTPSYMSPEQASGDKLTTQSDIYSLGTMMYELLTGKKPFVADTNLTLISLIAQGNYQKLDETYPHLPNRLIAIVHKAMTKNISDRYRNIGEIIRELNYFLQSPTQLQIKDFLEKYYVAATATDKSDFSPFEKYETNNQSGSSKSLRSTAGGNKKWRLAMIGIGAAVLLSLVLWYGFFYSQGSGTQDESFGLVNVSMKSAKREVLLQTRILINDKEYPLNEMDGKVVLQNFQKGRNALRIKFPVDFQSHEYNFVLDSPSDRKDFTLNLDKYIGDSRTTGLSIVTEPAGALIYLDNEKKAFGKTPLPLTYTSKTALHKITIGREGYRTLELERNFVPGENLSLLIELTPEKKK